MGFGEGTSSSGVVKIGWRASQDKLSEKVPRPEWYRWLKFPSRCTGAIISGYVQVPFPEVWFFVVDTVRLPIAGAVPELSYQGT